MREIQNRGRTANDVWGDFRFSVATGKIKGLYQRVQFGKNPDVDSSYEDIWAYGGIKPYPTTATTLNVVSSNAADDVGGAGATEIRVEYLDGDFNTKVVDVELNGIGSVQVATDFLRLQDAFVLYGAPAVGNIDLSYSGGVVGRIRVGRTDVENTQFTVPAGFTAYIVGANVGLGKSSDAQIDLQLRDATNGAIFRTYDEVSLFENNILFDYPLAFPVQEKHDIRIQAISAQGNSSVGVAYYMILRDNDIYRND